jgi:plasmid stabilization system protein ParE
MIFMVDSEIFMVYSEAALEIVAILHGRRDIGAIFEDSP